MPFVPSLARANNVKRCDIPYAGQTITIWYRPDAMTPTRLDELKVAAQATPDSVDADNDPETVRLILEFVSKWDVGEPVYNGHRDDNGNPLQAVDEQGNPVWSTWPVDREHVRQVSFPAQAAIINGMIQDFTPDPPSASGSQAG